MWITETDLNTVVKHQEQVSPWRPCVVIVTRGEQLYIQTSEKTKFVVAAAGLITVI